MFTMDEAVGNDDNDNTPFLDAYEQPEVFFDGNTTLFLGKARSRID